MHRNKQKAIAGFTLIELIVSMAINMIVIGAFYSVFAMQNKTVSVQQQIVDMQRNAKIAMETMIRDIRMAGYNPSKSNSGTGGIKPGITSVTYNSLSFAKDLNANGNTTANSSNPGENIAYELYNDNGISCLGRTSNGIRSRVAENIESLAFVNYDRDGNTLSMAAALENIRIIQVTIRAKAALPDHKYLDPAYGDHYRRHSLTFHVMPRNLE
jgi:type IV pilus assembly protein PilW